MIFKAIATIETISVARGFLVVDKMLKSADVDLITAKTICPGKFLVIVGGQVGAVKSALKAGLETGGESVSDSMLLPNVHSSLFPALACATSWEITKDLGVVETMSAPVALEAADAAAKAANITLLEIRIGQGMGTKTFFTFTGDVSDVKTAVQVSRNVVGEKGLLVDAIVISGPHKDLDNILV
jgi:microcompartment protein CcmL/EutN